MRFSKLLASTAVALAMLGGTAAAQAADAPFTLSGTAAVTSDYVFRGYSQTKEDPAFQVGLTASHESGFFVSAWGSNVDLGSSADVEVDLVAGYTNTIDNLTYTIGGYYYTYPGADSTAKFDYFEGGLDLAYAIDKVTLTGKLYYSPKFFGSAGGNAVYLNGGAAVAVTETVSVYGNVGFNELENGTDYKDYTAGIAVKFAPFTLDLKYTDTDLKDASTLMADGRFVATLTFAF